MKRCSPGSWLGTCQCGLFYCHAIPLVRPSRAGRAAFAARLTSCDSYLSSCCSHEASSRFWSSTIDWGLSVTSSILTNWCLPSAKLGYLWPRGPYDLSVKENRRAYFPHGKPEILSTLDKPVDKHCNLFFDPGISGHFCKFSHGYNRPVDRFPCASTP